MAKPRVVFFGNERLATGVSTTCPTLQKLLDGGYEITAVVVNHEPTASRKQRLLEIADLAERHEIPVLVPTRLADIAEQLAGYQADVGVLVAYGKLVPQSVIDIFPAGIVNIHPSLLPLHRGPTPLESVILDGSTKTGVSLMRLSKAMDAGDVYAYSELELLGDESKQQLADELLELGSEMLLATLERIVSGDIVGAPQDNAHATYDQLIQKQDGVLDFTKPATQLAREVRAYAGWPSSRTTLAGKDVVVTAAHSETADTKRTIGAPYRDGKKLLVQTSDGALAIDRLKPAGKADMPAAAFLAGYSPGAE